MFEGKEKAWEEFDNGPIDLTRVRWKDAGRGFGEEEEVSSIWLAEWSVCCWTRKKSSRERGIE